MFISSQLRKYFSLVKNYPKEMAILIIALCGSAFFVLLLGVEVKNIIADSSVLSADKNITRKFVELIILCGLLCVFIFLRSKAIADIADKIQNDIEQKIFEELVYFSYDFYSNNSASSVINRYKKEASFIHKAVEVFYSFFLRNMILVIGGVIMLFVSSWQLSCFLFIILPCVIVPSVFLVKKLKKSSEMFVKKENMLDSMREEMLDAFALVQVFNKQEDAAKKSAEAKEELKINIAKKNFHRSLYVAILIFIVALSIIAMIWFGAYQLKQNNLAVSDFVSFIYFAVIVGAAFAGMSEVFADLSKANNAAKEISEVIGYKNNFQFEADSIKKKKFIAFENVSLSKGENKILDNVSFEIKRGEHISIVGTSGQGKTTLINLLLGLIKPDAGEITCCNKKVTDNNLFAIRRSISYIQQEPKLFSGTVKENLLFINLDASEEDLFMVLKLVNLYDEVIKFPGGINYNVGSKGKKLSSGQKQRLAIAMALVKFPDVLILDEYASNLDSKNDEIITDRIKKFMKNKTVISISHNPSSQKKADKMLIIKDSAIKVIKSKQSVT